MREKSLMNRDVYPMVWRLLRQKRKRSEMAETPSSPDNNSGSNNNNRCNECNTLLPFGAKFCSNCGMQVGIEKDVYNVSGEGLVGKVKEIINDAKVKRINIKDDKRSEEHTSELQSHVNLVCRLLLEKK